jgi:hypothetical protein
LTATLLPTRPEDLPVAAPKRFVPTAPARKPVTFHLAIADGEDEVYTFTPPKTSGQLLDVLDPDDEDDGNAQLTTARANWQWFKRGLPPDEYDRLVARLRDPDDDLDDVTVAEIIRYLMGRDAKRPPTSRRG